MPNYVFVGFLSRFIWPGNSEMMYTASVKWPNLAARVPRCWRIISPFFSDLGLELLGSSHLQPNLEGIRQNPICRWVALGDFPSESILVAPGKRSPRCQTNCRKFTRWKKKIQFFLSSPVYSSNALERGQDGQLLKHAAPRTPFCASRRLLGLNSSLKGRSQTLPPTLKRNQTH